jgi:YfiH family protein
MGGLVGDEIHKVEMNRARAFEAVGKDPSSMYDVWQVHSSNVVCVDHPRTPGIPHLKADAILCNKPVVTLFMRFADCVPILLFDPGKKVVGLVHSGWQGTVKKILVNAIETMVRYYGSSIQDIRAGIGPSICAKHYEVGSDVVERINHAFGSISNQILKKVNNTVMFDLWEANRILLTQSGVTKIELSGLCTACQPEDWYSYRGEKGRTGRFGVLIGLNHINSLDD